MPPLVSRSKKKNEPIAPVENSVQTTNKTNTQTENKDELKTEYLTEDVGTEKENSQLSAHNKTHEPEPIEDKPSGKIEVQDATKPTGRAERRSLFSIQESIKPAQVEKEETEIIQPKRDKELIASKIDEIWDDFARKLEDNKDRLPAAMMRQCRPILEGTKLILEFETITQQNFFRDVRQQITDLLRNTLENDYLEFEISIAEREEAPAEDSQSDKLKKYIQQYPLMAKVIEEFKLDPDFI